MEAVLAAMTAALLTLFDMDRTFYVPEQTRRKSTLYAWWSGFVIANGLLAGGLYLVVQDWAAIADIHPIVRAVVVGLGYLGLIRLKFSTFPMSGREVPFGFEAFYEAAKEFAFRRINSIAKEARLQETMSLAQNKTLDELATVATLSIGHDALLSPTEKEEQKRWVLETLQAPDLDERWKKLRLADFIRSGRRP